MDHHPGDNPALIPHPTPRFTALHLVHCRRLRTKPYDCATFYCAPWYPGDDFASECAALSDDDKFVVRRMDRENGDRPIAWFPTLLDAKAYTNWLERWHVQAETRTFEQWLRDGMV